MAKIFISHSNFDRELAIRIADELIRFEHQPVADFNLLKPGDDLDKVLDGAIISADVFVVIISAQSVESKNVNSEIQFAYKLGKLIIPLALGKVMPPSIIANRYFVPISGTNLDKVAYDVHQQIILHFPLNKNPNHAAIKQRAQELIEDAEDWLNDLASEYSILISIRGEAEKIIVPGTLYDELLPDQKSLVWQFLTLVWRKKAFGSVGRSQLSPISLEEHIDMFMAITRKLLAAIRAKSPLSELLTIGAVKVDSRGELRASTLRAIAVLSDLSFPSLFSPWRYERLNEFLGLEPQPFPFGVNEIYNLTTSLLPKENQSKLINYVFPWLIYDAFAAPESGIIPDEDKEIEEDDSIEPNIGVREGNNSASYWILYCNADNWDFRKGNLGEYHATKKGGPILAHEHSLFKSVMPGDKILAYTYNKPASIRAIFNVTRELHMSDRGEIISLVVDTFFDLPVPWDKARTKVNSELSATIQFDEWRIDRLTQKEFEDIIALLPKKTTYLTPATDPTFDSDGRLDTKHDKLGFTHDVNSFASVISQKAVEPPLAIGLFGNWGSGKSFFMKQLKERIDENTTSGNPKYIKHVVHVPFNSWHYSDANLWASLVTNIFQALNQYAAKPGNDEQAIKAMYAKLEVTQLQLEEANKQLDENKARQNELTAVKSQLETEIREKKARLDGLGTKDIVQAVFTEPDIAAEIESVKEKTLGTETLNDIASINVKLDQVDSFVGRFCETVKLLKENSKGKWIAVWAFTFLTTGSLIAAVTFYMADIQKALQPWCLVVSGLAFVVNTLNVAPYMQKLNRLYKRLTNIKASIEKRAETIRYNEHAEKERLESELTTLRTKESALTAQITLKKAEGDAITAELENIRTGKKLASFLSKKVIDDTYSKHLGIISWIRKDFEELNSLFVQQKSVNEMKENNEQPNTQSQLQIDRIVLYIDDLDRCNEDIVVKVLEAIHLILAFKLFVVVVGVDPRWLNNALNEKYRSLFGAPERGKKKADSENGTEEDDLLSGAATTYDYLEKIFQIPFMIKPINTDGRNSLITHMLKDEMQKETSVAVGELGGTTNTSKTEPVAPAPLEDDPEAKEDTANINTGGAQPHKAAQPAPETNPATTEVGLSFTVAESSYMQSLAGIYGHSPRTIKRFVNIYRIIKSHRGSMISDTNTDNEHMALLFMLSIIVGYPQFVQSFITKLKAVKDQETLTLQEFLNQAQLNKELTTAIQNSLDADLSSMPITLLTQNLELVSRFSFRTLIV